MIFKPTGDRVLIERVEFENKTAGGLIIPDTSNKQKPTRGTILAKGDEVKNELIQVNSTAVFTKCYELKIDDKEFAVVNCEDILGILA